MAEQAQRLNQIRIVGIGEKINLVELQRVVNSSIGANKWQIERYEYDIRDELDKHFREERAGNHQEARYALSHAATATEWLEQSTLAYGRAIRMAHQLNMLVHSDEAVVETRE